LPALRPDPLSTDDRHFACTQCGKCCDRSPEVELGEAADLADMFVFRLMFRIYTLPRHLPDFLAKSLVPREQASIDFYETKRQLALHCAHSWIARIGTDAGQIETGKYLMLSALTLDKGQGTCLQLNNRTCRIHSRRPISCRTVPLHYSRGEAFAVRDFDKFTATPGYACETGPAAPQLLSGGRIVHPDILAGRTSARSQAVADRQWKAAIFRRLTRGDMPGLPSLDQIEDNARIGALTTSMRVAWQIAVEAGLMPDTAFRHAIDAQLASIDRALAETDLRSDYRDTLIQMRREYEQSLSPMYGESRRSILPGL
jgi:Fe-S-cluster containining protein